MIVFPKVRSCKCARPRVKKVTRAPSLVDHDVEQEMGRLRLASLKAKERQLRETNLELQAKLARTEAQLTDIPPVAGKWMLPRVSDISSLDK